ncbi:MAG: dTDP-4-dehydrorhamnose 3,5-epimerase [Anaerolineae bacterium]|nr:dTDP-4-dehydrorhamnose 3,5-epimerase [Thermoflexales bacterium]MDW8407234.1 dTDP-4-dehydrorhamnose 3,5-epimerase [Anaerolineae bacterium]
MSFRVQSLSIPEVVLIETRSFPDQRGFFRELFKASMFAGLGLPAHFVQDNFSYSVHGVLRGLHYQKEPCAQGKLVCAAHGAIYDVAVDIRRGSPTYGRWVGAELSAENGRMLYVPPGFAHGFCVLSDAAGVLYKVTAEWNGPLEAGVLWNDPDLGIEWPIKKPILSAKDAALPRLTDADNNFTY